MRNLNRCLIAAMLLCAPMLAKANLITNGGFETGNLSGWSCTGADLCQATNFGAVIFGAYTLVGYDKNGFATLSQTFATMAGQTYDFSFWSRGTIPWPSDILRYQIGTGPIVVTPETLLFTQTTDTFTAAGGTTQINFYFENEPSGGTGEWYIDNVSVTAAVPEPISIALLGLGLIGLSLGRRIRK